MSHDENMESRLQNIEARMNHVEGQVERLTGSIIGTLDGKPGVLALTQKSLDASRENSGKLDQITEQVEALKMNWKYAAGIALGVSFVVTLLCKFVFK